MGLHDKVIRALKPAEKVYREKDGQGLFLMVNPSGAKVWRLLYRFVGSQKALTLGPFPAVSVADARSKRDMAKGYIAEGIDPATLMDPKKIRQVREEETASENATLFAAVARDWFAAQMEGSRWEERYGPRVWERINSHLLPSLGKLPIGEVSDQDCLAALVAMEEKGLTDTVKKTKGYLGGILRYAKAKGLADTDHTRDIADALRPQPKPVDLPWLRMDEMSEFFRDMARPHEDAEITRIALRLTMHTVLRSSELRNGRWDQIKGDEWHVPGDQMKKVKGERLPHIVPLSHQSLALLERLREITGKSALMFPGARPGKVMSENTVLFCIYGFGWRGRVCGHGFRKTFSTHANESGDWNSDWIETQLAHIERNRVRGAYNKALYLPHRKRLVQWWSDELDRMERLGTLEDDLSDILG